MTKIGARLESVVREAMSRLLAHGEPQVSQVPGPGKWSAKQVIGHLIDSAANNHRRFVLAQRSDDLLFDGYDQELWIAVQPYQESSWADLVTLWSGYNRHLARLIAATPPEVLQRRRARHNLHVVSWRPVPESEPATLEYFMDDYVCHLEHHLAQAFRALGQEWKSVGCP